MRYGFHPAYAIYETRIPATRRYAATGAAVAAPDLPFHVLARLHLRFSPEDYGVTAYLNLLDQVAPGANWMIAGLTWTCSRYPRAVMEGGHVRVGLEDAPLGSDTSNLQWVEESVQRIGNAGGELATAKRCARCAGPEDRKPPREQSARPLYNLGLSTDRTTRKHELQDRHHHGRPVWYRAGNHRPRRWPRWIRRRARFPRGGSMDISGVPDKLIGTGLSSSTAWTRKAAMVPVPTC